MVAGRQASRAHSAARGVRQHLLRRPQAPPFVQGGEPFDLRAVYRAPRRGAGLRRSAIARYRRRRREPPAPFFRSPLDVCWTSDEIPNQLIEPLAACQLIPKVQKWRKKPTNIF